MGDNPDAKKEVNLLDLPWFILDKIALKLSLIPGGYFALENLAEASPHFLPAIRRTPMGLTEFHLKITKNSIVLMYQKQNKTVATRKVLLEPPQQDDLLEDDTISYNFYNQNERDWEGANAAVRHSMELFGKPVVHVEINMDGISPAAAPWLFPFDSCEKLRIEGSEPIPNGMLKFILSTYKPSNGILCNIPIHDDFYMDLSEQNSHLLLIRNVKWVTRRNIQSLQNAIVVFGKTSLGARDIESLIGHWFRSTNTRNHVIVFAVDFGMEDLRLERFRPMVFDAQRRGPIYHTRFEDIHCDLPNCRDIERSDGLLATITIQDGLFWFLVWHNRFPVPSS